MVIEQFMEWRKSMTNKISAIVITSCTATRTQEPKAKIEDLPEGYDMQEAMGSWLSLLNQFEADTCPSKLYRGLGFLTTTEMIDYVGRDGIKIVTGGQGLIGIDTMIVPYDFSANKSLPNNIHNVVSKEPFIQSWWWTEINRQLRDQVYPVAKLFRDNPDKLIILAMGNGFLRYLKDDLMRIAPEDLPRLRIVTTSKSTSAIPLQLRGSVIYYSKEIKQVTTGNRNNLVHRACLHFLELISTDDKDTLDIDAHRKLVEEALGVESYAFDTARIDIDQILEDDPELLKEENPDRAYMNARKKHGNIGSMSLFRSAWFKRKGIATTTITDPMKDAALTALKGIENDLEKVSGKSASWEDDEELLQTIGVFVDTLKKYSPNTKFTCHELCSWLVKYYEGLKREAPIRAKQPAKMAHFVSSHFEIFGLEQTRPDSGGRMLYYLGTELKKTAGE